MHAVELRDQDDRLEPRARVDLRATWSQGMRIGNGRLVDLSMRGTLLQCDEDLDDVPLRLRVHVPDAPDVEIVAEVRWTSPETPGLPCFHGLEFTDVSLGDRAQLGRVLKGPPPLEAPRPTLLDEAPVAAPPWTRLATMGLCALTCGLAAMALWLGLP